MAFSGEWKDSNAAIVEGARLFNTGAFFEAHEVLEEAWRPAVGPMKIFLKGLIHAAVAMHHYGKRNRHGALVKCASSRDYLRTASPGFAGVDVAGLILDLERWIEALSVESPDWERLEARPVIRFIGELSASSV